MGKKKISLEVVNPNAAGIDIGSKSHWVDKTFQNVPLLPVQKQVAAPIESVPIIGV